MMNGMHPLVARLAQSAGASPIDLASLDDWLARPGDRAAPCVCGARAAGTRSRAGRYDPNPGRPGRGECR